MYRQLSSRNQTTKGFKVKHALQVCVLIAVCVWLLYQVKHSHDKRQALEERSSGISTVVESNSELLRFGRKDIPLVETEPDVKTEETHNDEEGSDDTEAAETETKTEENEDEEEARGTGEDTIDESDQEGADEEEGHDEDTIDEKERDGKRDERDLSSNQDKETEANTQVAREENYKGDDASSAVVQHAETTESENINQGSGNSDEEKIDDIGSQNGTVEANGDIQTDDIKTDESGVSLENTEAYLSNNTTSMEIKSGADSVDNSTTMESNLSDEQSNNLTLENPFSSLLEMLNKSSVPVIAESLNSSLLESSNDLNSRHDQNSTMEIAEGGDNTISNTTNGEDFNSENLLIEQMVTSNTTDRVEGSEDGSTTSSIISEVGNGTTVQPAAHDSSVKIDEIAQDEKDDSGNASGHEFNDLSVNVDTVTQEEKDANDTAVQHESGDTAVSADAVTKEEKDINEDVVKLESDDSSVKADTVTENGRDANEDAVQREPNDASAKIDTVTEEERDARTDLSTLPEVQEETTIEDIAAE